MKKILLFFALLMPIVSYAQEQKETSSSQTIEFLSKNGSFIKKEFYDLPTVGTKYEGIDCQVLIITDMKSNKKIGCMRLTTHYSDDDYIGTLDPDEIDACELCLEKIQNDITPEIPNTYTEVEYKTRDNVSIAAFWSSKSEWEICVQTKSYTSRSLSFVEQSNLPILIQNLKDAKKMIEEKIK